jgi:hypothetical protein
MEVLVLEQCLGEQLGCRCIGVDEQREEPLFLLAEVRARVASKESQERGRGLAPFWRVCRRPPVEPSRLHQSVMVVVR